ncbi:hypothetical protein BDY19DRAFT_918418 [Irpex rosettiformis]|uniref:Uncharacterized protein n=1 Tax=Irpex rosettiformis TaxID=378272 RepID=A0ACB8UHE2_9APHY|nr:hypothetical protein BDY19DRAFT_918418 [Irpex rosettiformis]
MPSEAIMIRKYWPGLENLEYLIVFGDSYSSVQLEYDGRPLPTETNRLGALVPFPGTTWNEPGKPNWVGHFLSKPGVNTSLLVYDYAIGGHTVNNMRFQVLEEFVGTVNERPSCTPKDSLFVTWIGINDVLTFSDQKSSLKTLFELQEVLYRSGGARNFLFIDVPPIDRCPVFAPSAEHYQSWNTTLREAILTFISTHPDATAFLFSSHDLFTRILDHPEKYGFAKSTVNKAGGCFWYDYLHPTSQVHDVLATEMAQFLASESPRPVDDEESTKIMG